MHPIESSLTLDNACRLDWDVVVIGAGPAGCMAALQLAKTENRVLLVEKSEHPRFKVCGCCLNDAAVKMLESIGLKNRLLELNAVPVANLSLHSGAFQADLRLSQGLVVSRKVLDAELVRQSVKNGASYLSRTAAYVGVVENDCRVVHLEQNGATATIRARCVLVADGLGGRSLERAGLLPAVTAPDSRMGAGANATDFSQDLFDSGVIYMTTGRGGYVGMVKLDDGTLDIAAAFDRSFVQSFKHPGEAANALIESTRLSAIDLSALHWHGTAALTRRRAQLSAPKLLVIGDAASYAEPFTGEGISWALTSGNAVVEIVQKALNANSSFRYSEWDVMHKSLIARKQWVSMTIAHLLRHDSVMKLAIETLSVAPFLAGPIVRAIESQPTMRTPRNIVSTSRG